MIQQAQGLNATALEAIAGLERRTVAADGGRLKLEWDTLRGRPSDQTRDLLWWDAERLLGFLGIYGFRKGWFEVTGMVDPDARRRGIARELFTAALPLIHSGGAEHLLMVVPRVSQAGAGFARSLGMTYQHSEHALTLNSRPAPAQAGSELVLRQATTDDIPALSALFREGFGDDGYVDPARLRRERSWTAMIMLDGISVGTIALAHDGEQGGIYGFAVESGRRGNGIGRRTLIHACNALFNAGATRVDLEVEVDNDNALGLYTSVGFEPVATDDYYELQI